jgi:putative hydrolase of the HAD superfamily
MEVFHICQPMEDIQYKNIIFDLGGVIVDIDPPLSYSAIANLAQQPLTLEEFLLAHEQLFLDYEKGMISSHDFRNGIRKALNSTAADADIDIAWNSMLLHVPLERLQLLEKLKDRYQLFVLSNTNEIHVPAFNKIVEKISGQHDIAHFFHNVHYSHLMQMRKPEPQIYQAVLELNRLIPQETLFVDDRYENILAAQEAGMHTFHVTENRDIQEYFAHL